MRPITSTRFIYWLCTGYIWGIAVTFEKFFSIWKWVKVWKTFPVLPWIKASVLFRRGQFKKAIQYYDRGLHSNKSHPANFCARLDLAHCLREEGRILEAEKHLKYVVNNIPQSKEANLRLAKLQLATGRSLDAAWTLRRAMRFMPQDHQMLGLFLYAALDNKGPYFLIDEGLEHVKALDRRGVDMLLEAVLAKIQYQKKKSTTARNAFLELLEQEDLPVEVYIMVAELYFEGHDIFRARDILRAALEISPEHPRVLSLLAEIYLRSGTLYNASYARQLAQQACQKAHWLSPREMHVLAEAYYHLDDKISALIVASKAQEEGNRLLGSYKHSADLERLIENLSLSGSQA